MCLQGAVRTAAARSTVVSILFLQVFHRLVQHADQAILLIVRRDDKRHEYFSLANLKSLRRKNGFLLRHLFQGDMAVVPAG
jgi:hypothetical protein